MRYNFWTSCCIRFYRRKILFSKALPVSVKGLLVKQSVLSPRLIFLLLLKWKKLETSRRSERTIKRLAISISMPVLIDSHKRHKDWRFKPHENISLIIALPFPKRPIILQWCKMLFLESRGPKWPITVQSTQRKNMAGLLSWWNSKVELSAGSTTDFFLAV